MTSQTTCAVRWYGHDALARGILGLAVGGDNPDRLRGAMYPLTSEPVIRGLNAARRQKQAEGEDEREPLPRPHLESVRSTGRD
jgi:hypothetical protein